MVIEHDRQYAQHLIDKWFWRSWHLFAIVTGFSMDYFTPLEARTHSFKEFMQEWVIDQFLRSLEEFGLQRPWYWDTFERSLDFYHHMVYASAYSYRASVWFDFVVPGPRERAWLRAKYPASWAEIDPVWEQISRRWSESDPGNDFAVHASAIPSFCSLCQLVLCGGTPSKNTAVTLEHDGQKYILCSDPCRVLFEREPERYAGHKDLVKRVLDGEAPPNIVAMVRKYFGLDYNDWGKDVYGGRYRFIERRRP
jgi:toluene monooxygenase system protein A